jgi:N-acyl homoserine lactone hydrolase
MAVDDWSLWMLEYGHEPQHPVGAILRNDWRFESREIPYSYIYLEGFGHRVLIDVGLDLNSFGGQAALDGGLCDYQDADVVLAEVGVTPEQIDTIILTHVHADHAGNLRKFPNARVIVQAWELESWQEALRRGPRYAALLAALDPRDVFYLGELAEQGRLELLDGSATDRLPSLDIRPAHGTHTEGSQYVTIRTPHRNWVAAGDNLFSYQNVEGLDSGAYVPIGFGTGSSWRGVEIIEEMAAAASTSSQLLIVHERETYHRFFGWTTEHGLGVAELHLAEGVASRAPRQRGEVDDDRRISSH